jgi:hypothetical protein
VTSSSTSKIVKAREPGNLDFEVEYENTSVVYRLPKDGYFKLHKKGDVVEVYEHDVAYYIENLFHMVESRKDSVFYIEDYEKFPITEDAIPYKARLKIEKGITGFGHLTCHPLQAPDDEY